MPLRDRTGPRGLGSMTGRSAGYCAGYAVPGYINSGFGRGGGRSRGWSGGFGRGRNWGRGRAWEPASLGAAPYADVPYAGVPRAAYASPRSSEEELAQLKDQARYFEGALEQIKRHIEDLESKPEEE